MLTPLRLVKSITYDREEGSYNLEWVFRARHQVILLARLSIAHVTDAD